MWQSTSNNTKVIIASFLLLVAILVFSSFEKTPELITKEKALTALSNAKTLERVMVKTPYIYIYTNSGTYKIAEDAIEKDKLFSTGKVEYYEESTETMDMVLFIVLLALMFYILYIMRDSRKNQERLMEKQKEETVKQQDIGKLNIIAQRSDINFSNVAGIEDVKEELEEIIDFLRYPAKYREYDISLPKGVLLIGPPGVGKTLVAKAVAGEADVPFFYQSAASFVQIYVGMGAKRVSELFAKAKEMAPSIIFIDELDAVGKSRGGGQSNEEREATLNQLLTEMDGFEESSGVMVIAATNKIEVLDEALLRAGRFDRRIHIGLPDFTERISTLNLYLNGKKHNVNVKRIANMTIGFNSAALATLVNEAALYALRIKKETIETSDMESVKEKVLLGKHKIKTYNEEERKIQALYQAAKAVTASWLDVEFEKVGIISSSFIPHHNEILSKTVLLNELKVLLAGRIATQKVYGELFTNAKEDIKLAKVLAHKIIEEFALSDEYFASAHEAQKLLDEASDEVTSLLSKLASVVENVSTYLLENESITAKETKRIIDDLF